MLHGTTCPDKIRISRHSGEKFDLRKYFLIIISLALVSIHIQAQNGWTKKADFPIGSGASACVIDGKIYVMGGLHADLSDGAENYKYDPSTDIWEVKAPLPTARAFLFTAAVNDTIYAMGGGYAIATKKVEAYDPITNSWTTKTDMLGPRIGTNAGVVDGIIYIIGGNYNQHNCQAYDPSTDTWAEKTPIPVGGGGALSATVYNGLIYTFGGSTYSPWAALSTVYAYNPQTDTWVQKQNMPTPRFGLQTYLVNKKIYAIGGSMYQSNSLATVEVYDPVNNTWASGTNMINSLTFFAGAVVNDKIYVFGGTADWVTGPGEVWEYNPYIPVELTSFNGNVINGKVILEWKTATELNNYGFEIQRKALGGDFATIAFVKGRGTTTQQNEYSFTDKNLEEGKYFYRLKQLDFNGAFEYSNIIEVEVRTLDKFTLEQNYPNPFNPTTIVGYVLQEKSNVKLKLLNAIGEEMAVLVNEEQEKGYHKVEFDGSNLSSGVYFYRIQAGNFIETKKLILMR